MKYEIIKGSEKDFEGAPEWALYVEVFRGNVFASEGYTVGDRYIALTGLDKGEEFIVDDETNPPSRIIAERRPINPVWSGEGLPPIGVECEVKRALDWMKCKILFISDHHVVLTSEEEICWQTQACQFRPIRSPEDVARDEAIAKMISILNEGTSTQNDARDIYDAIAAGKIPGVKLE